MAPKPEETARAEIDRLLKAAGWEVAAAADVNIRAHRGVAIREFPLKDGYGFADYMLYADGKAVGVLEAKKSGVTLSGVEPQSERYVRGLPEGLHNAAIYVDGPPHDEADQIRADEAITQRLMEAGYIVVRFHHKAAWNEIFRRHPDIFGTPRA